MELVAPLFITNAEFTSVLAIKNSADRPVRVLASFDSLEGEEVGQRLIDLGPGSTSTIDVDSIEMVIHRFAAVGSVSIRTTTGRADGISASLTIATRNSNGRLSRAEDFQIADDKPRPIQVASIPAPFSVPVLTVHSLSTLPQSIGTEPSPMIGLDGHPVIVEGLKWSLRVGDGYQDLPNGSFKRLYSHGNSRKAAADFGPRGVQYTLGRAEDGYVAAGCAVFPRFVRAFRPRERRPHAAIGPFPATN